MLNDFFKLIKVGLKVNIQLSKVKRARRKIQKKYGLDHKILILKELLLRNTN